MSSQAALTTNKSFKSYPQIIITKLQSKFKFDRNLPNGVKCTILSSHKFIFIYFVWNYHKSKTNSLSTHVPGNSLEKWIDVGYACPVLLWEKYLIYLYIDTLQNQPLSPQKNVSKNKLSVTSSPQIKQVFWIHRPFTSFILREKKRKI